MEPKTSPVRHSLCTRTSTGGNRSSGGTSGSGTSGATTRNSGGFADASGQSAAATGAVRGSTGAGAGAAATYDPAADLGRLGMERLQGLLRQGGEIGKKLDFLIQEAFREINTCGNKAQNLEISRMVVDFKAELEKCREQVQS